MLAASARLTPAESRAIGRAVSRIVGILIRDLGWGWGIAAVGGMALAGYAAWTFPTWWNWFLDWLDE